MLTLMSATRRIAAAGAFAVLISVLLGASGDHTGAQKREGTIAFVRTPLGGPSPKAGVTLFVIHADGTGLRRLTAPGSYVDGYRWSPDGSLIAYLDQRSLWLVRPDGSGRVRLVSRSILNIVSLTWSPDGKALAVGAWDPARKPPWPGKRRVELYVVPTNGGTPQGLQVGEIRDVSWSPLGDEIAYVTLHGEIKTLRTDGSSGTSMPMRASNSCDGPAWSADGKRLAVACGDSPNRYAYIDVVNSDGSVLRRLTKHAYNEYGFAWSPNGRSILYGRENSQGIYVIGADGRNDRRVTPDAPARTAWGALTWAPDGRSIAYTTGRTGRGDVYVIDANGRNKLRLTRSSGIDLDPAWAPG